MQKNKKIKLALTGATGKVGKELQLLLQKKEFRELFELRALFSRKEKNYKILKECDVLIDFSRPEFTLKIAQKATEYNKNLKLIIATTGFKAKELVKLKSTLKSQSWCLISNTSIGVFLFHQALELLGHLIPAKTFKLKLTETHHIKKVDSPSGTAVTLKKSLEKHSTEDFQLEIKSIRKGKIFGIHELKIYNSSEEFIIRHKAKNRSLFAKGALNLAQKIHNKRFKKGLIPSEKLFS